MSSNDVHPKDVHSNDAQPKDAQPKEVQPKDVQLRLANPRGFCAGVDACQVDMVSWKDEVGVVEGVVACDAGDGLVDFLFGGALSGALGGEAVPDDVGQRIAAAHGVVGAGDGGRRGGGGRLGGARDVGEHVLEGGLLEGVLGGASGEPGRGPGVRAHGGLAR